VTPTRDAIGLLEAKGLVAVLAGVEAMCKSAVVECVLIRRVSSGFLVAAVRGSTGAVQHALSAGAEAAAQHGTLRRRQLYARPDPQITALLSSGVPWLRRPEPTGTADTD
jgi:ethanolamine utilization protein EutM